MRQAKAQLETSKSNLIAGQTEHKSAAAEYRKFFGVEANNLQNIDLNDQLKNQDITSLITIAEASHLPLKLQKVELAIAQAEQIIASSAILPRADISGSASNNDNEYFDSNTSDYTIKFELTIPIYNNGTNYANHSQSRAKVTRLEYQLNATRNNMHSQITRDYYNYIYATKHIISNKSNLDASKLALSALEIAYKNKDRNLIELLNQQQAHTASKLQLARSQRDLILSHYNLLATLGNLDVAD